MYNFAPGPAMLPDVVRQQIHDEWLNWSNLGFSITEVSHRNQLFEHIIDENIALLKTILSIPDEYEILFLPGGAQTQFALIPMNLLGQSQQADYLVYGHWSQAAYQEASRYGDIKQINILSDSVPYSLNIGHLADSIRPHSVYLHYCSNETIESICLPDLAASLDLPIVVDMSSDILSKPIDVSRFKLIYASTQKNLGVSGLCVVIVHRDLLDQAMPLTPSILNYKKQAAAKSLLNTINTFACYVLNLVLKWTQAQGDLAHIAQHNHEKAALLYSYLDQQDFYQNQVAADYRSLMNVTFSAPNQELNQLFVKEAEKHGLYALKGHKVFGGMRASIYNAMPIAGIKCLVDFMRQFAKQHG